MGVAVGDYDNDGSLIYVTTTEKNILYHNNGDGTSPMYSKSRSRWVAGLSPRGFRYDNEVS